MPPPGRTRIKICGMTNAHDALAAAALGADAVGFVFAPSPRRMDPAQVRPIVGALPPFVAAVGVFVDAPAEAIAQAMEESGCHAVQLHGGEPPELIGRLGRWPVVRAIRVRQPSDLDVIPALAGAAAVLLDTYVEGRQGGTGVAFDWTLAAQAGRFGRPVILAGGLEPDNVARAVAQARPFAVDVSSGVESGPGKKDRDRMERFIHAVGAAYREAT